MASPTYAAPPTALRLSTSSQEQTRASLEVAAGILRASGLVAFPTETVYGLGASATSVDAVSSIYTAKGRPSDNPLIVHVSSREMMLDLLPRREAGVPALYEPLMRRFWPGPLTLIFKLDASDEPARRVVAPAVTAGQASLAIRMPSHPLALALIKEADLPLAAPSANLSSRPSPTTAAHVQSDLGEGRGLGAILDGGPCDVGVESTVVDFVPPAREGEEGRLRVLRAGGVSAEEIEACVKETGFGAASNGESGHVQVYKRDFSSQELESRPTTPGMKYKHYAPTNARVVLVRPTRRPDAAPATISSDGEVDVSAVPTLQDLIAFSTFASTSEEPYRVGLMLTDETLAELRPLSSETLSPESPVARITLPPSSTPAEDIPFSPPDEPTQLYSYPLGSSTRPLEAGQRLFAGLRYFDSMPRAEDNGEPAGVDLILVECVEEEGVGLAVMERARKAAGGAGEMSFRL